MCYYCDGTNPIVLYVQSWLTKSHIWSYIKELYDGVLLVKVLNV
jgi:hypothetical protein